MRRQLRVAGCGWRVAWSRLPAFILLPSSFCLLVLSGCNGKPKGNGTGGVVVDNRGNVIKGPAPRADGLTLRRPPSDPELPALSVEDARAVFRLVRSDALRKMSGQLSRKTLTEFSDLELPESLFVQNGSYVIVSLYPAGGAEPRFGFAAAGTLGFSAAAAAYAALGDGDPAILKAAKIKIDLASSIAPCGPDARLVPGVEGLIVANKGLALLPPDQFLADAPTMKDYLRKLVRRAGLPEGFEDKKNELMLAKFATTSALQLADGAEPVFLYRGNALIEAPTRTASWSSAVLGMEWLRANYGGGGSLPAAFLPYVNRPDDNEAGPNVGPLVALAFFAETRDDRNRGETKSGKRLAEGNARALAGLKAAVQIDPRHKFGYCSQADADGLVLVSSGALALVALCERERAGGEDSERSMMKALADFLLAQQTPEGEFLSHFDPNQGRPVKKLAEVNFPGQAILALVRLYELDGRKDARLLAAARKAARRLVAAQRAAIEEGLRKGAKGAALCTPDAWLMQALDALTAVEPDAELSGHLLALADATVAGQVTPGKTRFPDLIGGMDESDPPTVAMTAARGEGLSAALRTARRLGKAEAAARIEQALDLAAGFVILNQYRPENAYALPKPDATIGGFRTSPLAGSVRPETTAHAALFLLEYAQLRSAVK
ncbi:MAG TPA: hypothetical protein PK280_10550 [Planctomycetota bacterium]|nr:hypothetical protein [Planctomycetota bacterium]